MKATDLMFGNWVAYKDQPSIPLQVNGISKDKVYLKHSLYWNWKKGTYERIERPSEVNYEDLVPIEITPENLEKNGWDKVKSPEGFDMMVLSDDSHATLWWFVDTSTLMLLGGSILIIKYFHEIQNALTLCKIEKQIEP